MKKYVDADALIQEIKDTDEIINHDTYTADGMHRAYANVVATIGRMPAADVEPVEHGEWVQVLHFDDVPVRCSVCKFATYEPLNYCPNCGAKNGRR